jgi:hypothetical protein
MNKKEKASDEKMFQGGDSPFPFGNAQRMYEMMTKCCGGEGSPMDCCSMMRRMMDHGKGAGAKETKETQKPPKGRTNG